MLIDDKEGVPKGTDPVFALEDAACVNIELTNESLTGVDVGVPASSLVLNG